MAAHERQVASHEKGVDPAATRLRVMALARTDLERAFLRAYLSEDDTPGCGAVLGIEHLSAVEQTRGVHGMIMRLRQRALRSGSRNSSKSVSNTGAEIE